MSLQAPSVRVELVKSVFTNSTVHLHSLHIHLGPADRPPQPLQKFSDLEVCPEKVCTLFGPLLRGLARFSTLPSTILTKSKKP